MKNNKGFATSFILFSLLALFLIVVSVLLFTMNNSSSLSNTTKNKLLYNIENTESNIKTMYRFSYTGTEQKFTVPAAGAYKIELWGAESTTSGKGAYTKGVIVLDKNYILYINVGQKDGYNNGITDIRTISNTESNSNNYRIMYSGYNKDTSYISGNSNYSVHSSGIKFKDTLIKSGNEQIPTYDGTSNMLGNSGNGYAKITYYSVTAEYLEYSNKVTKLNCSSVQCALDEIQKLINH